MCSHLLLSSYYTTFYRIGPKGLNNLMQISAKRHGEAFMFYDFYDHLNNIHIL